MRLLHEGDLLRCFRNSVSVTYVSTLPSTSSSAPCISSFVQSLSTFETNVREWHFVQHSPNTDIRIHRHHFREVKDPVRDPRFIATGQAAIAAKTCGKVDVLTTTPIGCRTFPSPSATPCRGRIYKAYRGRPGVFGTSCLDTRAIYVNHQTFWVEILCGLIFLSYFEVVVGII